MTKLEISESIERFREDASNTIWTDPDIGAYLLRVADIMSEMNGVSQSDVSLRITGFHSEGPSSGGGSD